jgi:hypothetical protein
MQSIYKYTISILLCVFVLFAKAQDKKPQEPKPAVPWWNGMFVQVDVASPVASAFSNGESFSMEAAAQLTIKKKYYPIVELGFANINKFTANNNGFDGGGLFGRVGVDFNLLKQKENSKPTNNLFLAGVRLGMSNFNYDITNLSIVDDYWGGSEALIYNNKNATKVWYEVVAGVRVEVLKNMYMGWTVRNKNQITSDTDGSVSPWYIPGFGHNASNSWGFNYIIGYKF